MEPTKNFGADEYYKRLKASKVICVDFDNTICLDEWPEVGPVIPGAIEVLKALQKAGHKLILFTQRNHHYPICCESLKQLYNDNPNIIFEKNGDDVRLDILTPALEICRKNGIEFWDVNSNAEWEELTDDKSRKIYMDYIIDDHSVGIKHLKITNRFGETCRVIDWFSIDRWCVDEELYKDCAIKLSYLDYIKEIRKI